MSETGTMPQQQADIDEVASAVARIHASCGHSNFIFGCLADGEPMAWCRKCGVSYARAATMRKVMAAEKRQQKRTRRS